MGGALEWRGSARLLLVLAALVRTHARLGFHRPSPPPPPPPAEDMAEEGLRGKTLTLKLKLTSFEVGRVWGGAVERQGEGQGQRACSIVPCSGLHAMCWLGWCARQRA